MDELKNYILILEDVIPHTLCDHILNEYINSNEWEDAVVKGDSNGNGEIKKEIRNCTVISISSDKTIEKNKDIRKKIDNNVFKCTEDVIKKYNERFKLSHVSKDTGYDLLKYEKGGFYTQHVDSFTAIPRTISCSFVLNNDFKGGEFSFFNNKLTYSLKKGSAIIFPSNFLYPHSVLPIIDGTRYSIVTWFI
jgi:predicted 2-oxoglutarate/Fe(II)-dependent dioxygenase YbiX